MLRLMVLLMLSSLLAACTATTPAPLTAWTATDPTAEPSAAAPLEPVPMPPVPQGRSDRTNDYTMIKGGFYEPDSGSLDDGYIVNVAFGHYFTQFLALELEIGYLNSEGSPSSLIDTIRGTPLMANARVTVPLSSSVNLYGGGGIGGIYYDIEALVAILDTDGWLFAGNFFFGADLDLSDTFFLGVEAKYYVTEDLGSGDLDAFAAFVTLGVQY